MLQTWYLPWLATADDTLTVKACISDNCHDYASVKTTASSKRYITAFDDGSVLKNASNEFKGSKLLAVYDRHKNKISFLAADQHCSKDGEPACPTGGALEQRNERYLHWSVLGAADLSDDVYSLAIANKKLFVGLANSNKVNVYHIEPYTNANDTVSWDAKSEITAPDHFSQFGFSLAVVDDGQHLNDGKHLVVGSPADNKIAYIRLKMTMC